MGIKWKKAFGYENLAEISKTGEVKILARSWTFGIGSIRTRQTFITKGSYNNEGYLRINIRVNGKQKSATVHRLVALAFIPNPLKLPEVNHLDGDKSNNNHWNLEWSSHRGNIIHAYTTGLILPTKGEKNGRSKLTEKQVLEIRETYNKEKPYMDILAKEYKVSYSLICSIINRKIWKHI
jgi:hypothetical protein